MDIVENSPDGVPSVPRAQVSQKLEPSRICDILGVPEHMVVNDELHSYHPGPDLADASIGWGLIRHILDLEPDGIALQFGVGQGTSGRIIAEHMPLIGFDSFQGLPEDWRPGYPKGSLAHAEPRIANATMVAGWFVDTLPVFDWDAIGYVGVVHFDADLYSSTATALQHMGYLLCRGTYIVFDEFIGFVEHEQKAWKEYVAKRPGIAWDVVGHDNEAWGIRIR